MIHVTYSNRTEALLTALAAVVRQERGALGPWAAIQLVVPNRNIETYVKLGLAQQLGIAAHLEVAFLRGMLGRIGERLVPGARLVDARQIEGHLIALLHDESFLADAELAPVREYLLAAGPRPDVVDRRRCQLSAELARLFEEYAASRPEMLRAWKERAVFGDHPAQAAVEVWQRRLWLAVFGPQGRLARLRAEGGPVALTLADLIGVLEAGDFPSEALPAGAIHVFGVSYIARSFHAALGALARRAPVRVYTLNPCREFWEDLETTGELRRRLKRQGREGLFPARAEARQTSLALGDDPFGLQDDRENLPLRLWGRPGRENVRLHQPAGSRRLRGAVRLQPGRRRAGHPAAAAAGRHPGPGASRRLRTPSCAPTAASRCCPARGCGASWR